MPRTGFDPSKHGFHFANGFEGKVAIVPGFGEVPTRGRGGGMAFAALDYWYTGLPVPTHRPQDFPGGSLPEDGTRLADYLYKRLFDSFATSSTRQFVTWTLAADQATWADRSRTPVRDAPNGAGWAEGAYTIDFVIEATPLGEEAGP